MHILLQYHFDETPQRLSAGYRAEMQTQLETALLWDSIMFRIDTGDLL